jgi:hypothetical protein
MENRVLYIVLSLFLFNGLYAQKETSAVKTDTMPDRFYVLQNVYRDGESLPEIEIKEVSIIGKRKGSPVKRIKYDRLVYNVRKVYPYALIVRYRLQQVKIDIEKLPDDKAKKEYLKKVEKEVFAEYEDDMRQMSMTQGKILIKLIDRETKNTSYDLIRDYRGRISAAFWQGVARIFGTNLKEQYDPYGEDAPIERIIEEIESGRI